ncbi:MAG: aminotransferase class I/II-fold pyridoxal phosphate-dependent enzyme [Fibrobacterota bacterium]
MNPQAEKLNAIIRNENESVFSLLSRKGQKSFFPAGGILAQGAEAAECDLNATIGIALNDDGVAAGLGPLKKMVDLPPDAIFKYASSFGIDELRTTWKSMLQEKNPSLQGHVSTPVVTAALTHAIFTATNLFLNEEDSLICPDYYWGNYRLVLQNGAGAHIQTYETFKNGGYNIDGLRDCLRQGGPGKKAVILNFPNNPTGYTVTHDEAFALRDMFRDIAREGSSVVVFIDDAYFGLVFRDGVYGESLFSLLADCHESILAVKIDGATKEDYAWGFRVGFITYGIRRGNEELYSALESKTAGFVRSSISNAPGISQNLLLACYKSEEYAAEKREMYDMLRGRFTEVDRILQEHEEYGRYFEPLPYNSGYFMCLKLKEGLDAEAVRKKLVGSYSVGLIALGRILRIAFSCTPRKDLPALFDGVYAACQDME